MSRATQYTERCTTHGEGAFWDEVAGRLLLVDMMVGAVVEVAADGSPRRHEFGGVAAAIRARAEGGYVLAVERGFQLLDADLTPTGEVVAAFSDPAIRMNDGGCDPQGRFYCGTMAYDETPGAGTVYRLDADRSVHPVLAGVTISNGVQWHADGRSVYYNDTPTGRVDRYAFDPGAGSFGERSTFAVIEEGEGAPDGMAIDEQGGVWVALWGGGAVHRYDGDGRLTEVVELPVQDVTSCTFGGDGRRTLFITTSRQTKGEQAEAEAGAVFAFEAGVAGAPQYAYAG